MYEYTEEVRDIVDPVDYDWTQDVNGLLEDEDVE